MESDDLVARFNYLQALVSDEVVHPFMDKRGRTITLRATFLKLEHPRDLVVYDCEIKLDPPSRSDERQLQNRLVSLFGRSQELAPLIHTIAQETAQRLVARKNVPPNFSATVANYSDGEGEANSIIESCNVRLLYPKDQSSQRVPRFCRSDVSADHAAFNLIVTSHVLRTPLPDDGRTAASVFRS